MKGVTTVSTEALRDYWHPVAFSSEVTDRPAPVTLLDERVVLYRTASGRAVAHKDLCIHRGTPLSLGWVEEETLVCAYHGWSYAPEGKCIRIPLVDPARKIPPKARLTPGISIGIVPGPGGFMSAYARGSTAHLPP